MISSCFGREFNKPQYAHVCSQCGFKDICAKKSKPSRARTVLVL